MSEIGAATNHRRSRSTKDDLPSVSRIDRVRKAAIESGVPAVPAASASICNPAKDRLFRRHRRRFGKRKRKGDIRGDKGNGDLLAQTDYSIRHKSRDSTRHYGTSRAIIFSTSVCWQVASGILAMLHTLMKAVVSSFGKSLLGVLTWGGNSFKYHRRPFVASSSSSRFRRR